jgi:hypothetical protein
MSTIRAFPLPPVPHYDTPKIKSTLSESNRPLLVSRNLKENETVLQYVLLPWTKPLLCTKGAALIKRTGKKEEETGTESSQAILVYQSTTSIFNAEHVNCVN